MATVAQACVVLAPENTDQAAPEASLQIVPDLADPPIIDPYAAKKGVSAEFKILGAIKQSHTRQPLYYYWLVNYEPAKNIKVSAFLLTDCLLAKQTCTVDFCGLTTASQSEHRLRVVVADSELKATATTPWGFAAGTVFDSVEWTVKVKECQ